MRVIEIAGVTYRTIDPAADADRAARHHHDACVATYGDDGRYEGRAQYLRYLREQAEVYPDGTVLAFDGEECVGQLELRVPYGLAVGYVNLYYVTPACRGRGYGRLLHDYAEHYFRSWEADRVELHVAPANVRAVRFYRRLGYEFANTRIRPADRLWKMTKRLD